MIPTKVAIFLSMEDREDFNIYDKLAYLIKSLEGDSYYLIEELPTRKIITEEFGTAIYRIVTEELTYKDIFLIASEWLNY